MNEENNGNVIRVLFFSFCLWMLVFVGCTSFNKAYDKIVDKYIKPEKQTPVDTFTELNFVVGGFKVSSASWDGSAEITNLTVSNGLTYQWVKGGCENLGASNRTDASKTIACLFCKVNNVWVGGKFDWISTSRTSRDFKNIKENYHGWDMSMIEEATAYRFVIISSDGKRRTNVIEVIR
jgi:hypothetical protein